MKYAIYDKAADAYLTTMDFDTEVPDNYTQYAISYNEYITKARLLDTKEEAADVVTRIERFKFMDKGRFVMHSFDDTLNDQYIISEAGNPTKVVESITVDLDGTINVKYGTMVSHWSATSLIYVINKLNKLQDASAPTRYCSWNATFDIYKVITVIDENGHNHYQFINVTAKGLENAKEEADPLNKRIEELEKANYELGEQVAERGIVANRLLDENNSLKAKVESIKKEARDWKKLYENADTDREELKNAIDIIHTDLVSSRACDNLKNTLKAIKRNSGLDRISMENFLTAKDEIRSIISHVITILESRELNQSVAFSSAEEVDRAKRLAYAIIDICEATTAPLEANLNKFSQLYEAVNYPSDNDDVITFAFKGVLGIFSSLEDRVRNIIDESVTWKHKAQKAENELEDQKKLNDANKATIAYLSVKKIAKDKELSDWKMRTKEAIRDYTKCNEALGEWKQKYRAIQEERDKALERAEFYKRQANSVYGMTIPSRCNGKQMFCDIATGKKILIDKKKYDELVEWINTINTTYDTMFFMNKPAYLPIMIEHLNDLTK